MKSALLTTLALATSASAHDFKPCSGAGGGMGITSVELTPDPPVEGANLEVAFSATPKRAITAGDKLNIDIELHGIKLTSVDFDLCKIAGGACPYAAGTALNPKATCELVGGVFFWDFLGFVVFWLGGGLWLWWVLPLVELERENNNKTQQKCRE
jgi:hypothetical protein